MNGGPFPERWATLKKAVRSERADLYHYMLGQSFEGNAEIIISIPRRWPSETYITGVNTQTALRTTGGLPQSAHEILAALGYHADPIWMTDAGLTDQPCRLYIYYGRVEWAPLQVRGGELL